jgi:hypothetical protein
MEGLSKTTETLGPGRDSTRQPPDYKTEAVSLEPTSSVKLGEDSNQPSVEYRNRTLPLRYLIRWAQENLTREPLYPTRDSDPGRPH